VRKRLNLTYLLLGIAASLVVLVAFITGAPSVPALFEKLQTRRPGSSTLSEATADPITFVSFLTGALDKRLTDIQRNEFVRSHNGRRVTWEGYVIGVKEDRMGPNRAFHLTFRSEPRQADWGPFHWNFAMAWFPDAAKQDLLTLRDGQQVVVSGILDAARDPGHPTLSDPRLEKIYP